MRRRRSPARFLAPLALIAAAFAVYALVQPAVDNGTASTSSSTSSTASAAKKPSVHSLKRAKTYVVKKGDTLSGIAEKTGLTVEHIQALNPGLDANTLAVGRKLTLRE